ncbi:hypothetical protein MHU86_22793 [Fragilaria crotonensis]|nr:hypothetical protein MHU86_22793 [Fragilaria crotonensis]
MGDDAVDEENIALCCALCCVNCGIYKDGDCTGCSGKLGFCCLQCEVCCKPSALASRSSAVVLSLSATAALSSMLSSRSASLSSPLLFHATRRCQLLSLFLVLLSTLRLAAA